MELGKVLHKVLGKALGMACSTLVGMVLDSMGLCRSSSLKEQQLQRTMLRLMLFSS
jgi:hypothetical protein